MIWPRWSKATGISSSSTPRPATTSTHAVLTQIIVEQESRKGGQTLLPIPFLRQLIRFYGDSIERMVPSYLQVSLETLAKEQERFRKQFAGAFTPAGAFEAYQEQARKNLAMFEQAMADVLALRPTKPGGVRRRPSPARSRRKLPSRLRAHRRRRDEIADLKAQLANIQSKLEKLSDDRE